MSKLRDNLKRDSILLQYICPWGISYDSIMGRYGFECRTDDMTFDKIRDYTEMAGLDFDNACFNSFVGSARGLDNVTMVSWDRELPGNLILPGEVILLNSGTQEELGLLKIAEGKYLTVKSEDPEKILISICTDINEAFSPGMRVDFDVMKSYPVRWIHILPPPRINRVVDYSMSKHYNRALVAEDISELIPVLMQPLSTGHFEKYFNEITTTFASKGISSWAIRVIADAYVKKYMK